MEEKSQTLSLLNIKQICDLTHSSRASVIKYLEDAAVQIHSERNLHKFYPAREALLAVFNRQDALKNRKLFLKKPDSSDDESDILDPQIENAKLARAKRQKVQLEIDLIKKDLIETKDVERVWTDMVIATRTRLASLPSRMALKVIGTDDKNKVIALLDKEIRKALDELSEFNIEQYITTGEESDDETQASASFES